MTAIVLAVPVVEPQREAPRDRERRRSYGPQILLAVGWIGLFAYCVTYLTEDMPFRTSASLAVGEPTFDQPEDLPAGSAPTPRATAEYVGTWGPTTEACGAAARRHGYLPAIITPERARAGDTLCTFRDTHRSGNVWTMAADCAGQDRRWSSHVRLVVEGDRLTWTSAWGTSAYIRCGRRAG